MAIVKCQTDLPQVSGLIEASGGLALVSLGTFEDPFGHTWHISTHIEDVSGAELDRRAKAAMAQHKKS